MAELSMKEKHHPLRVDADQAGRSPVDGAGTQRFVGDG
jgi:hypothetical protein